MPFLQTTWVVDIPFRSPMAACQLAHDLRYCDELIEARLEGGGWRRSGLVYVSHMESQRVFLWLFKYVWMQVDCSFWFPKVIIMACKTI